MKVLVTGASGFVGKNVIEELKKIYDINDIVAFSSKVIEGIKTVNSDYLSLSKDFMVKNGCNDIEVLIHLGAFTPKETSDANNIEMSVSNINNTIALLNSLTKLQKIIFISTLDVYENTTNRIVESMNTIPSTMYGWSKLYCEQVVKQFAETKGVIYQILRLGHVYGEGEEAYRKVMPIMIKNAIEGSNIKIYGNGKAIRTFIHVNDVAKAIVNSIELNSSEIINIVGDEEISIGELAVMIQGLSEDKVNIDFIDCNAPNRDCIFDNSKIKKYLLKDYIPFKVGLEEEFKYMKELLKK